MNQPTDCVDVPDDGAREARLGFGLDDWFVGALRGLYQDYRRSGGDGYASRVTDNVERIIGRPASSLDRVLSETTFGGTDARKA
jgi:hypothetical protein